MKNSEEFIVEIASLNKDYYVSNYLLMPKDDNIFNKILERMEYLGIDVFLGSVNFINDFQQLEDESGQDLGMIIKLNKEQNNLNKNIEIESSNMVTPYNHNNFEIKNIEIDNTTPVIYRSIKDEFKVPPKMGLKNVGATCYMNASLQCLNHIEKLVNYFKYDNNLEKIIKSLPKEEPNLSSSFKILIENLWPSNNKYTKNEDINSTGTNKYYSPNEFKNKISIMNILFKGIQANDAKDLLNFIIMTLHEELNIYKDQNTDKISDMSQTNKELRIQEYINKFQMSNKSIISDLFYGINCIYVYCSRCHLIKYNIEAFFILFFPLEEIRKFKIQSFNCQNNLMMNPMLFQQNFMIQNNLINTNSINIDDCFRYYQNENIFTGENSMYCNNCQMLTISSMKTVIYEGPEILLFVLNRKNAEHVKLEFIEHINLQNYIENFSKGYKYGLIGVVTHLGGNDSSGHFISCCKSPIDNNWYKYNDAMVSPVKNFQEEIIDYAMPYILVYQKES